MEHLQRHTHTESFRYQAEARATLRALSVHESPTILVFGCSIGDEVLPFATALPDAKILAVDINAEALAAASVLLEPFANVTVAHSKWEQVAEFGPFDAILANSVFCRHPEGLAAKVLDELPFAQWDGLVGQLVENLAPGGVFQVVNSNYRISLASAASLLDALPLPAVQHSGFVPRFAASGHKVVHIERRRLDDGLDFWIAPELAVDVAAELSAALYCRKGADTAAVAARVGEPFVGVETIGPVSVRTQVPDGDGPEGFVACKAERRFSAAGVGGVAQYFADALVVNGVAIGTRLQSF